MTIVCSRLRLSWRNLGWWRRRESDYEVALKTLKLLIFQDAQNYQNAQKSRLKYATSTRNQPALCSASLRQSCHSLLHDSIACKIACFSSAGIAESSNFPTI